MKANFRLRFRTKALFISLALKTNQKLRSFGAWLLHCAISTSAKHSGTTFESWLMKSSQRDCLTMLAVSDLLELPEPCQLDTFMSALYRVNGHTTTGPCSTTPGSQSNQDLRTNKSSNVNLTEKALHEKTQAFSESASEDGLSIQTLLSSDTTIH